MLTSFHCKFCQHKWLSGATIPNFLGRPKHLPLLMVCPSVKYPKCASVIIYLFYYPLMCYLAFCFSINTLSNHTHKVTSVNQGVCLRTSTNKTTWHIKVLHVSFGSSGGRLLVQSHPNQLGGYQVNGLPDKPKSVFFTALFPAFNNRHAKKIVRLPKDS